MKHFLFAVSILSCAVTADAQTSTNLQGLTARAGGQLIGGVCQPFVCTPQVGVLPRGASVDFRVHGPTFGFFALAAGDTSAVGCTNVPGVANALLLAGTPVTLAVGTLNIVSLPSICGLAEGQLVLSVPQSLPPGTQVAVQAVVVTPPSGGRTGSAAFTNGLALTVQ